MVPPAATDAPPATGRRLEGGAHSLHHMAAVLHAAADQAGSQGRAAGRPTVLIVDQPDVLLAAAGGAGDGGESRDGISAAALTDLLFDLREVCVVPLSFSTDRSLQTGCLIRCLLFFTRPDGKSPCNYNWGWLN